MSKKVAIIGSGYVGLVTATCLADSGNDIVCVDNNIEKIKEFKKGNTIIYEPNLKSLFQKNIKKGRLHFTHETVKAVKENTIIFMALPTPMGENHKADLSAVISVCNQIKDHLTDYKVIVTKSTVPVGTNRIIKDLLSKGKKANFDIVSNPEFLKEGNAVNDFQKPDRIVIGTDSEKAKKEMFDLYQPFVIQGNPILYMNIESAEITKYASNSFLATKISFINQLANFCEIVGANIDEVKKGMGTDSRIGNKFLYPGLGYGGSCFPKDVQAFIQTGLEYNFNFKILEAVEDINQQQHILFFEKIKKYFKDDLKDKTISIWGLAFKAGTNDVRESKSLYLIQSLIQANALVKVFDPEAIQTAQEELGDKVIYSADEYDCVKNADALIITTEWNEFRNPDWDCLSVSMKQKVIFDGRNILNQESIEKMGFDYQSIGRPKNKI